MKAGLVLLMLLMCSPFAHAATTQTKKPTKPKPVKLESTVTPCVKRVTSDTLLTREQRRKVFTRKSDGTKWLISDENCIQFDKKNIKILGAIKIDHAALKFSNLNLKLKLDNHTKILWEWEKVRLPIWRESIGLLKGSNGILLEQNKTLRNTLQLMKGLRKSRPWHEHPAFVATVSVLATAGVVAFSVWVVRETNQLNTATATKPLLSF